VLISGTSTLLPPSKSESVAGPPPKSSVLSDSARQSSRHHDTNPHSHSSSSFNSTLRMSKSSNSRIRKQPDMPELTRGRLPTSGSANVRRSTVWNEHVLRLMTTLLIVSTSTLLVHVLNCRCQRLTFS